MGDSGPPATARLRVIAAAIPLNLLPAAMAALLQSPTLGRLRGAGMALLAGGHLDDAASLFDALASVAGEHAWVHAGRAEVAMRREAWETAAAAWRFCLTRFANALSPDWLTELARAERMLGHDEEAIAIWEQALLACPQHAAPGWYQSLAELCRGLGRTEQAEAAMDAMAATFPNTDAARTRVASLAARRHDWPAALLLWTKCLQAAAPDAVKPAWLAGRAQALFRLDRVEEALAAWESLIHRFPDFPAARLQMAHAARELSNWNLMRHCYAEQIARFPDLVAPEWLAGVARGWLMTGDFGAAAATIAALDERFADNPIACRLRIEFYQIKNTGLNGIATALESAIARFPDDRPLLAEYSRFLLASGRPEDAETAVRRLEETGDDHFALTSRWRLEMDIAGEPSLQPRVTAAVESRPWIAASALPAASFLLAVWSGWPAVLARRLVDNLPASNARDLMRARARVVLCEDAMAMEIIGGIPAPYQSQFALELRAWAARQSGDLAAAQDIWRGIMSAHYFPAIHGPEPRLELQNTGPLPAPDGVTAFTNIRNEMAHLPEFLRHHRALGVRRFVFVDNLSTDAGPAFLAAQPDVILYRTADSFQNALAGMRWINTLREHHGAGGWCLYADADEALIYPGWETLKLDRVTQHLDAEGADALAGFMLDVFPQKLLDADGTPTVHASYRYYDANYEWLGQVRAPYFQPAGGVRARLFGVNEVLHKTPLLRHGAGIYLGPHNTTPVRLSGVTCALLHYKLLNLAMRYQPARPGIDGNPYMADRPSDLMRRHVRYAARMADVLGADLRQPGITMELGDSLALAERGLMQAPAEFRDWLLGSAS